MSVADGLECDTILDGIRYVWSQDPVLSPIRFYDDDLAMDAPEVPYALCFLGPGSPPVRLAGRNYVEQIAGTIKVVCSPTQTRSIGRQIRLLLSNLGRVSTKEGAILRCIISHGSKVRLPGGNHQLSFPIQLTVVEYRGPERLRKQ